MDARRPDRKAIDRVTAVIRGHQPSRSAAQAQVWAQVFCDARHGAGLLHHAGKSDGEKLDRLLRALERALRQVDGMSPWLRVTLDNALLDHALERTRGDVRDDLSLEAAVLVLQALRASAERSGEVMDGTGRPRGKLNWRAAAVIEETNRFWSDCGESVPGKVLNRETKYARFLEDLFDALSIGADVSAAYDAWYRAASDPRTPLATP